MRDLNSYKPLVDQFACAGHVYEVTVRWSPEDRGKHMRAFVWDGGAIEPNEEVLKQLASRRGHASHWTKRGEDKVMDSAWDAYNHLIVANKQALLEHALKLIEAPDTAKYRWSRKAGCACGCSPGFVVEGVAKGFNMWIERMGKEVKS